MRTILWTIRQPRYAALSAAMLLVVAICIAAGTWQLDRYKTSIRDNAALRGNARAAVTTLDALGVSSTGGGAVPGRNAVAYRQVRVAGTYVQQAPEFVTSITVDGKQGFWVLSPVRASDRIVLVVRGFVAAGTDGTPPTVAPVPTGSVQLTGRLDPTSTDDDNATRVSGRVAVESINAGDQAARLGAPVAQAYVSLLARQPGTSGLTPVPAPDLSNPAGGAPPWQHFAYIVQWYLFAVLALFAPFAMRRYDVREAQRRYLGLDVDALEFGTDTPAGRAQLGGEAPSGVVAVRDSGSLVRVEDVVAARWSRAERLADRYGRSMGIDRTPSPDVAQALARQVIAAADGSADLTQNGLNRAADAYHGAYNDHLWELALADGATPDIQAAPLDDSAEAREIEEPPKRSNKIIEG